MCILSILIFDMCCCFTPTAVWPQPTAPPQVNGNILAVRNLSPLIRRWSTHVRHKWPMIMLADHTHKCTKRTTKHQFRLLLRWKHFQKGENCPEGDEPLLMYVHLHSQAFFLPPPLHPFIFLHNRNYKFFPSNQKLWRISCVNLCPIPS